MQGQLIKTSKNVRYLGVYFDDKLMFRKHIEIRTALRWEVANIIKKLAQDINL